MEAKADTIPNGGKDFERPVYPALAIAITADLWRAIETRRTSRKKKSGVATTYSGRRKKETKSDDTHARTVSKKARAVDER